MKRRSAIERLDDVVARLWSGYHNSPEAGMRAYRRALRALLRERADAAVNDLRSCSGIRLHAKPAYWAGVEMTVRDAILRRAKR